MAEDFTITANGLSGISDLNNSLSKAKSLENQDIKSKAQMEKATKGFEALLLQEMMKSMWATVDTTGLLGEDSNQSQIYRSMFNQAVADEIAKGDGVGVQDFLEKELNKTLAASKDKA